MPYNSPYIGGGGVGSNWGNFPGVQEMLARDWKTAREGMNALGSVGGAVGGGVVGGFQGHAAPETFGEGTSPSSGAFQGFMTNLDKGLNGGGQGGISSMMGGEGGGGGGGGMNVKQLQLGKKAAKSMWEMVAEGQLTKPDQEAKAFGMTKGEFDNLGAREQIATVHGAIQANAFKEVQAKLQEYAALTAHRQALTAQAGADLTADTSFANAARVAGQGPPNYMKGGAVDILGQPSPAQVQGAAMANPTSPSAQNWMRHAAGLEAAPNLQFQEDPVSGDRFATFGRSMSPSGVNPLKVAGKGPIMSEDKQFYFSGGQWRPVKAETPEPGAQPLTSPDGNFYWNGTRWVAKREDPNAAFIEALKGGKSGGGGGATNSQSGLRYRKNPVTGRVERY